MSSEKKAGGALRVDCHNHTMFSPDGAGTVEEKLVRAKELGLCAIAITDHCECQAYEEEYRERAFRAWEAMERAKVPKGITFLKGIELGQPTQNPEGAKDALARGYDFVLGSLHNLKDEEDFCYMSFSPKRRGEAESLLQRYFEEELEVARSADFDSLAHMTYPLRYISRRDGVEIDLRKFESVTDEIFRTLIKREKALEVNTSGYTEDGGPCPDGTLLKRYFDLGGRLVTVGSDSHVTERIGFGCERGINLLFEIGFREIAIYEGRRAKLLPIT